MTARLDHPIRTSDSQKVAATFQLPLANLEAFGATEDLLLENRNYMVLVDFLTTLGGADPNEVVRKALGHTLSPELAEQLNWMGRGDKRAFGKTIMAQVIKGN